MLNDPVGRLLMVGFPGDRFDDGLRDLLLDVRPGGIILFKRNVGGGPSQVADLIEACQDLARTEFGRPLLTAIDQEGGPVRRLAPPFSVLPSQREMSEKRSRDEVRALAGIGGRELAAVGFNMNLTPVMDLATDPEATFMTERSFGPDPDRAVDLGLAVIDGHAEHGVLTCVKHFPGIGDTRLDPHDDLPSVDYSVERIKKIESVPFARAIEHGVAGVMTAHINFPALDPDWPGTLSHKILTGFLRGDLGFSGLIMTDDLEMGAVVKHYQPGPAAVRAVLAGSDQLLICHRADRIRAVKQALLEAVDKGEITERRLEESAGRLETALAKTAPPRTGALREVFNIHA